MTDEKLIALLYGQANALGEDWPETAASRIKVLRDALTLAANRLAAASVNASGDYQHQYEYAEWSEEARASLQVEHTRSIKTRIKADASSPSGTAVHPVPYEVPFDASNPNQRTTR